MARAVSTILDMNDPFPEVELRLLSGDTIQMPEDLGGTYGIILFYRGYW